MDHRFGTQAQKRTRSSLQKERPIAVIVVDANILFSYFAERSFTHELINTLGIGLCTPQFCFDELDAYKDVICRKSNISKRQYTTIKKQLQRRVQIVSLESYASFVPAAIKISPDEDDVDFFAVCMLKDCPLWSNDKKLKEQNTVTVLSTTDIVANLDGSTV